MGKNREQAQAAKAEKKAALAKQAKKPGYLSKYGQKHRERVAEELRERRLEGSTI